MHYVFIADAVSLGLVTSRGAGCGQSRYDDLVAMVTVSIIHCRPIGFSGEVNGSGWMTRLDYHHSAANNKHPPNVFSMLGQRR